MERKRRKPKNSDDGICRAMVTGLISRGARAARMREPSICGTAKQSKAGAGARASRFASANFSSSESMLHVDEPCRAQRTHPRTHHRYAAARTRSKRQQLVRMLAWPRASTHLPEPSVSIDSKMRRKCDFHTCSRVPRLRRDCAHLPAGAEEDRSARKPASPLTVRLHGTVLYCNSTIPRGSATT